MRKNKLIVGILIFMSMLIGCIFLNTSNAATLGDLAITRERTVKTVKASDGTTINVKYKHKLGDNKNIWKIVKARDTGVAGPSKDKLVTDPSDPEYLADLYCLRAGQGFTAEQTNNPSTGTPGSQIPTVEDGAKIVTYNQSVKINKKDVEQSFNTLVGLYSQTVNNNPNYEILFKPENKEKFYAVLWILDNMLLESASSSELQAYLLDENRAGYIYPEDGASNIDSGDSYRAASVIENGKLMVRNVLTRADIEAVQQAAIWYLTNYDDPEYHNNSKLELTPMKLSVSGDEVFNTGTKGIPNEYEPFGTIYNVNLTLFDEITGEEMPAPYNGAWGNFRAKHANILFTNLINSALKAVRENGGTYTPTRDITIYFNNGNVEGKGDGLVYEQPVVQVEEPKAEPDIALRKFISAIDGKDLISAISREPEVDTSKLNQGLNTTAEYFHRKDAQPVEIGNVVTYTIRLYNEGDVPAYVKQVRDYLPSYLSRTIPNGKTDTASYWNDVENNGYVYETTANCKIVNAGGLLTIDEDEARRTGKTYVGGKTLGEVKLPAAYKNEGETGKDRYTLSYVDIEIYCEVLPNAEYGKVITNIAEVTKMADENNVEITEERDSGTEADRRADLHLGNHASTEIGPISEYKQTTIDQEEQKHPDHRYYIEGQEDDDDFDKVVVKMPSVDLALRKSIAKIGSKNYNRIPQVNTDGLIEKPRQDTAIYNHDKEPLDAKVGDIVIYKMRVYNEGETSGSVTQITDHIPDYLEYVKEIEDANGNKINVDFWTENEGDKAGYTKLISKANCKITGAGGKLTMDPTETGKIYVGDKTLGDAIQIPAFDYNADLTHTPSYIEVEVYCKISTRVKETMTLTNIAEITKELDQNGKEVVPGQDRDSEPGNVTLPDIKDLPKYEGGLDKDLTDNFKPGQQDDDDFEKVIVKVPAYDLSLRKFITEVNGKELTGENSRIPVVNTEVLDNHSDTTAKYEHTKKPVEVNRGNKVVYTIRVYNEGDFDTYVSEITDYLPNYLVYLKDDPINKLYGWGEPDPVTRQIKTTITAKDNIEGNELYKDRVSKNGEKGKILAKYDEDGVLDYIDVKIVCQVAENTEGNSILTNLAQITKMTDKDGVEVPEDRDSKPNGDKDGEFYIPSDKDRPNYEGGEDKDLTDNYKPGQEDDDDFEKVIVKNFDLALRKFITKVQNTNINNRYPKPIYENGEIKYEHPKDPVEVCPKDIVIYTIRVYNEGQADGYAEEITDNLPEGIEYLPDHEINQKYKWIMLDENEEEITDGDVSRAKYITTDYLSSKTNRNEGNKNLLKAFDPDADISDNADKKNPDYRDVEVAFKVTYVAKTIEDSKKIIKNVAQISGDSGDDIDSDPSRKEEYDYEDEKNNEDDIDYDNIRVKYFDLSLLKWVTETRVKLGDKEEIISSGYTIDTPSVQEKKEPAVMYPIAEKNINKIQVKYAFTIRVTNEGELAGYAEEVKDYVPEGLKFDPKDNPDWRQLEDGSVVTNKLAGTLLQPGESAEVQIILTWINGAQNVGEKVNWAEISKDKNDYDAPDVDSTPDNFEKGEDDIDNSPVILAINTGSAKIYIGLIAIILLTFGLGIDLIKKYVLE